MGEITEEAAWHRGAAVTWRGSAVRSVMVGSGADGETWSRGCHANGSIPVVERAIFYVLVFGIEMLIFIVSYCKQAQPQHSR